MRSSHRQPGPSAEPVQDKDPAPGREPVRGTEPLADLVYHAISLWIPATWGTIAFVLLRRTRHQPLTLRPPRGECRPPWPPEAPWQRFRRYREEHAHDVERRTQPAE